ncbi:hypothetical protein [Burkholderia sp. AW49-1]
MIGAKLLAPATLTAHFIVMRAFPKTWAVEIARIGIAMFFLLALLVAPAIRPDLEASLNKISAFLLSVALFFAYSPLLGLFDWRLGRAGGARRRYRTAST